MKTITLKGLFLLISICFGIGIQAQNIYFYKNNQSEISYSIKKIRSLIFTDNKLHVNFKTGSMDSIDLAVLNKLTFNINTNVEKPLSLNPHLKVFPNPVAEVLSVEYGGNLEKGVLDVEIYSLNGVKVYSAIFNLDSNKTLLISILNLKSGVYLLKMKDGEKTFTQRFIKK